MSKEEIELRDLVAQTLENNGVLSRIRAELRASVFLALEEQESVMDSPQFTNKPLKAFLSTAEGSLVACLVREFLEFFQLDFTLSVFDPETAQGKYYNYDGRSKLIKDLQIENLNGKKGPLLAQILHTTLSQNADSSSIKREGNKPSNGKNTPMPSTMGNTTSQSSALLDTTNNILGERTTTPRNVSLLRTEVATNKANSANVSTETKPISLIEEASKQPTDINKVPRVKDVPFPTVTEELSPRSTSVSEVEHTSQSSKEANKSKTGSSETTHRNSPTPEQSLTHSKPETQAASNSESIQKSNSTSEATQKSNSNSDSKKKRPQQTNKPNVEPATKPATSTLSSLSNLPPLMGVNFPMKQPVGFIPGINQPKDMHQIKTMIDLGLESQDNYDEDFHSSASISGKEDPANQGTDTEIEEELGSGVDDLLSSASALDDLTADATLSNLTCVADYMEDVK